MIYKNVNGTQKLVTNIRKPKKWRRFEYLLSSGTLYIDTDYIPTNFTKVILDFKNNVTNDGFFFGGRDKYSGTSCFCLHKDYALFGNDMGSGYSISTSTSRNLIALSLEGIYINNILKHAYANKTFTSPKTLKLFAMEQSAGMYPTKSSISVYMFKVYDNNTLIRDFIPAQYNGQYGMWDLVENKFYGNKGTGTFTVGPEIANYDEIEKLIIPGNLFIPRGLEFYTYLQGDGQAYIDTECLLNRASTISITMQLTAKTNQDRYVGILKSGLNILMYSEDSGNNIKTYTNITSGGTYGTLIAHNTNIHHYYINDSSHKSYCDGTSKVTHTSVPTTDDYLGSCYLFWANGAASGGQATCRIYSCRIYDNNVLARDLHPCCYLGEPGVWDTVENKFYGNAGSGNLVLGNKITNDLKEVSTSMPLYDPTIYTEPDGSEWVHIFHHNNPASNLFASTDTFLSQVHTDENRWFDISYCFKLQKYEFLLKQSLTAGSTEYKYRWIQDINPMVAGYNDVPRSKVTYITSTGYTNPSTAYGGLCRGIGSTYLRANNNAANNWWGAVGAWGLSNSYVPSWNGQQVTTGCIDLYVRKVTNYQEIPVWVLKNALIGDGIAYIDTGIKNIINCEFGIVVEQTELLSDFPTILGANDTSSTYKVIFGYGATSGTFYSQTGGNSGWTRFIAKDLNKHTMIAKIYANSAEFTFDNTNYTASYANTSSQTKSLYLFARNNYNGNTVSNTKQKVYSLYIKDNGVLIRDFVPATMGGRPGLYDKVNHKMYFNANSSGNFTVE